MRRLNLKLYSWLLMAFAIPCVGETLRVGINSYQAPHTLFANAVVGFESRIVVDAFNQADTEVALVPYQGNARVIQAYRKKDIQCILNPPPDLGTHHSKPFYAFQNVAITLRSRALVISSLSDLGELKVNAFQLAYRFLGDSLKAIDMIEYKEVANQSLQPLLLMRKRADVVISDLKIFEHHWSDQFPDKIMSDYVEVHNIIPPVNHTIGCRSLLWVNKFESGLRKI